MAIIKWEPFSDIDRFFDERPMFSFQKFGWDLAVDLYEQGGALIAKMTLPGIDPKNLGISAEEEALRVSGSREEEKETGKEGERYYDHEIRRGEFSRVIRLPKAIDPSAVEATYTDGILKVTMPMVRGQRRNAVKVEVKRSK